MSKGKLSPEFLEKLKAATNIIDIVGEHVVLKKAGSNFSGLCPFHAERTPSFSVTEQKQFYYCYGCKRGGDAIKFVEEIQGISFLEAVEELAERARIALPKDFSGSSEDENPEIAKRKAAARAKIATAYKLNRFAAAFFHNALTKETHIREYFEKRGVGAELGREFYVGAAPVSWNALSDHLAAKKAPIPLAVELGLVKPSPKGSGTFDLFRNRAMFPIIDMRGKVVGFGGRALPLPKNAPDVGGESPKYLNSPESLIFQKGKVAYGLYQAQKYIREKDEIILVEGYFDALALHSAGFRNTVATCGTSLTPDHLHLFKRLGSKLVVLFDGDKAGVSATERAMEIGLEHGSVIYGAAMPAGMDPDELLLGPGGPERMTEILQKVEPLLDSRIAASVSEARTGGAEAKARAIKQIGSWLGRFTDPVGKAVRLESAARALEISEQLLAKTMVQDPKRQAGQPHPVSQVRQVPPMRQAQRPFSPGPSRGKPARKETISRGDRILLAAWVRGEAQKLFTSLGAKLPPKATFSDLFSYEPARTWTAQVLAGLTSVDQIRQTPERYLDPNTDGQVQSIVREALISEASNTPESELKIATDRAIARCWARFSQRIKLALADAEAKKDARLHSKLLQEYLDVQRKMKELSSFYDEA